MSSSDSRNYTGLTQQQLDMLVGRGDVEIVEEKRYQQEMDEFDPVLVERIDVTLRVRRLK